MSLCAEARARRQARPRARKKRIFCITLVLLYDIEIAWAKQLGRTVKCEGKLDLNVVRSDRLKVIVDA